MRPRRGRGGHPGRPPRRIDVLDVRGRELIEKPIHVAVENALFVDSPHDLYDEEFSGVCSFTVARQVLVNRSVLTTYSNGDQRITGTFKQRLINLTTGEFIDVNSSGPILLDYHADGSLTETDWGRQFERPPGQLLLTTGPVVWEFDSAGNFVSFTQRGGTTQDVCVLLG